MSTDLTPRVGEREPMCMPGEASTVESNTVVECDSDAVSHNQQRTNFEEHKLAASPAGASTSFTGSCDDPGPSVETGGADNVASKANCVVKHPSAHQLKDRGSRRWLVTLVSFLCNGVMFGIINSYGEMFSALLQQMQLVGVANAAFKCSLVGSLGTGLTFFMSIISGVMSDRLGVRRTALLGAGFVTSGLLASSLCITKVELLYLTYGLMFGTGCSLLNTSSLVILGHYHWRHLGLANGLVSSGSSVFTMLMPFVMSSLLPRIGIDGTFQALALMSALMVPSVLLFRPMNTRQSVTEPPVSTNQRASWRQYLSQLLRLEIWRNRRFLVWAISVPLGLFGYFVPYVHLVLFVKSRYPGYNATWLVPCIGLTSGFGRVVFGKVADLPRVNKIVLQQVSFVVIGLCTILLAVSSSYWQLYAIVLAMGVFDGCFVALMGPIAFELVSDGAAEDGDDGGASQAIGSVLTLCSLPLTIGPPVAGYLFDRTSSYSVSFLVAGCPPLLAAAAMCAIHRIAPQMSTTKRAKQMMAEKQGMANAQL